MAVRRPRVKALANLSSKRKVKKEPDDSGPVNTEITIKQEVDINNASDKDQCAESDSNRNQELVFDHKPSKVENPISSERSDHSADNDPANLLEEDFHLIEKHSNLSQQNSNATFNASTENEFKCPLLKSIKSSAQQSLMESDQMLDASQQHNISTNSPVKPRQRIRPMPYFAVRRNSVQGSGADSEDESRRHKTSAMAINSPITLDSKASFPNSNRKRTESTCSNISESNFTRDGRPRKIFATEESQRISAARKEFQSKFNGKPPEKALLKMFDFIYYNPSTNPMKQQVQKAENEDDKKEENQTPEQSEPSADQSEEKSEPEKQKDDAPSMPVPQLKLGPNGELVLDETSLVIETTAEKEARAKLAKTNVIYVDENTENNGFYKRQKRTKDWTSDETIKFYRCLHTVGTDFSLMLTLFPNRSRRDLKLKFKKEERHNLALVNKALLYPRTFDIEELKSELLKDEEEAAVRLKEWQEITKKQTLKKPPKHKRHKKKSTGDRCLKHGDAVYENENSVPQKKNKMQNEVPEVVQSESDAEQNDDWQTTEQELYDTLIESDDEVKAKNIDGVGNEDSSSQHLDALKNAGVESKFFANVNNVLREIANGSLVVVSSEDPNNPEEVIHEIYVISKETGELSDEPLELPDDVMQCIISTMQA